jgi:hypothetical protein
MIFKCFLAVLLLAFSSIAFGHGGGEHDERQHIMLQKLVADLSSLQDSASGEGQLIALVTAALVSAYHDESENFDSETQVAKQKLISKYIEFAKERWKNRPRTLREGLTTAGEFGSLLGKTLKELPEKIFSHGYSGYHEFGWMYLTVVGVTYPPWYITSELVEHVVLGAPLGTACTALQLGYFAVIRSFVAPVSQVCTYAMADLQKLPWYKKLGRIPKGVALAFQDYLRLRLIKKQFRKVGLQGVSNLLSISQQDLKSSRWYQKASETLRSLSRNFVLWPAVLGLSQDLVSENDRYSAGTVTPSWNPELTRFRSSFERYALLMWTLSQLGSWIDELREERILDFKEYSGLLKIKANISRDINRSYVLERKFPEMADSTLSNIVPEFNDLLTLIERAESYSLSQDDIDKVQEKFTSCARSLKGL